MVMFRMGRLCGGHMLRSTISPICTVPGSLEHNILIACRNISSSKGRVGDVEDEEDEENEEDEVDETWPAKTC